MSGNRGLRICIAATGLGHVTRGVESWADDLGTALAQRGEQVLLCKGAGKAEEPHERVIPCWTRDSRPTQRLLRCLPNAIGWRVGLGTAYDIEQSTFALGLIRLLRREQIDILHVQDPQLALLTQHAARTGLCATRTVFGHVTEEPLELLRRIDFLHHVAPWHHERSIAGGFENDSWTMIPNFIDTHQFRPGTEAQLRQALSIPGSAIVVLVSSAIKRSHKRVDYLIDEFTELVRRRADLNLVLVIAGGRERETDEMVRRGEAKLGDRVRFLIQFPRNRMPELYRIADVLIHGSLFEMFGTVLLEASASGLPSIVHHHPVMQWVVGPGGWAIDMSISGNLTATLQSVLDDPNGRAVLARAAREHCCQNFSQAVVVDQYLNFYEHVLRRSRLAA